MKKFLGLIVILAAAVAALTSAAEVQEGRTLKGTVVNRDTGEPIQYASVTLIRAGDPDFSRNDGTDHDGRFEFRGLSEGRYFIHAGYRDLQSVREWLEIGAGSGEIRTRIEMRREVGGAGLVLLDADGVRVLSDLEPMNLASVDGVVRNGETEATLEYANVVLTRNSNGLVWGAMSESGGTFSLTGLPDGSYTLKILYLGFRPVEQSVVLRPGDSRKFLFDLEVTVVKEFDVTERLPAELKDALNEESGADIGQASGLATADVDASRVQSAPAVRLNKMGRAYSTQAVDDKGEEALDRLMSDTDELWILERPSAKRPADPDGDPGTGCLVVIQEDQEVPVPLEHTDVYARIDGYIASVDVRQRFHNPFDETIEAEYVFPLPHDAAVNDFLMVVGERRIRGIIREKEEAREIYERARRAGHVASLLEQERPNIFRQRVANIEPGHKIEIELHYFNALPYRDGEFEFAFPLVVGPRFNPPNSVDPIGAVPRGTQVDGTAVSYLAPNERSGHDVNITVELDAGLEIIDLESLNHATKVRADDEQTALIELAANDRIPNKDFVLRYRVASRVVESGVLVHREGEDGYFSMMLVPPASLAGLHRAPVEFVFVLDCSGSMSGWPMEKSKMAMRRALQQLQAGDSFQIVRFSESASALGAAPVEATPENIRRGLDYVDRLHGGGGTMMIEGIKAALDFPHDLERSRIVTFMTDGYIGNEAEIFGEMALRLGDTRIFSFGVGQSVNRHLLEGMARLGRGAVAYIGLNDNLDAVDEFYRIVRHPALTDITIDWGDMGAEQVFPQRIGDLFVGRPVLVHGRYQGEGRTTVKVSGNAAGQRITMEIDVDLDATVKRESLPLIWARSEIQHIADRLTREADDSLESRGLDLALNYNLVSDWTSFVAVDASEVVSEPGDRTVPVPVPVPEGVKYDTTVGGR